MADPGRAAHAGRPSVTAMTVVAVVALLGGWFALTIQDGEALAPDSAAAPQAPNLDPMPTLASLPDAPHVPARRPRPVATTRSSR